jgi:ribosomal protein S18 acetylase RimI-like enzyme
VTGDHDPAASVPPAARIEILRATAADAELVASLVREGFRSEAERYGVEIPPMRETASDLVASLADGDVVLVARLGGEPVGTVRGHVREDGSVMVRRLAVLPSARRRGVARDLMSVLEAAYPQVARFEIFTGVETAPAIALYESLGYVRTREEEQMPGVRIVYLEKRR